MENERGLWFLRPVMQWEDEERASWDLEEMRSEFRKRLYKETKMITLKPANSGGYRVYEGDYCIGEFVEAKFYQTGYCWWPMDGQYGQETLVAVARALGEANLQRLQETSGPSTEVVGRNYVPPTDFSQEPF